MQAMEESFAFASQLLELLSPELAKPYRFRMVDLRIKGLLANGNKEEAGSLLHELRELANGDPKLERECYELGRM